MQVGQARSVWLSGYLIDLVWFVYLVDLVHLVSFVQPNKRDRPNKPNNGLLTLAGFFSILLDVNCDTWPQKDELKREGRQS